MFNQKNNYSACFALTPASTGAMYRLIFGHFAGLSIDGMSSKSAELLEKIENEIVNLNSMPEFNELF